MNVMFSKWKHKQNLNSESSVIGGLEKDGDGSEHPRSYRTHLIFAGKRDPEATQTQSSVSQPGSHYFGPHSSHLSFSSHSNHPFAQVQQQSRQVMMPISSASHFHLQQPPSDTARRKGSRGGLYDEQDWNRNAGANQKVTLSSSQWASSNYNSSLQQGQTQNSLQVSPSSLYDGNGQENVVGKPGMLEVVAGLSRDCFIIPLACVDRFLPAGLTLPIPELLQNSKSRNNNNTTNGTVMGTPLNIMEVADPQLMVVAHLMTPLIPLNPLNIESPMSQSERIQRAIGLEILHRAASERKASHGLLLASMENSSDFPLVTLYVVPKLRTDANDFVESTRKNALEMFDPSQLGYCGDHFFHLCREVATIARPSVENPVRKGKCSTTGYIISIFRVFEGDDREKLERNWLYWTGARTLYRHLPKGVGLRRITLHKSAAVSGDKLYLLLCECANFLENVNSAAQLLPALRARLCGYTGIYRVAGAF